MSTEPLVQVSDEQKEDISQQTSDDDEFIVLNNPIKKYSAGYILRLILFSICILGPITLMILHIIYKYQTNHSLVRVFVTFFGYACLASFTVAILTGSKFPLLEKTFTVTSILTWHKYSVIVGIICLLGHVIPFFWDTKIHKTSVQKRFIRTFLFVNTSGQVTNTIRYSTYIMIICIIISVLRKKPGRRGFISWPIWKGVHWFMYIWYFLTAYHVFFIDWDHLTLHFPINSLFEWWQNHAVLWFLYLLGLAGFVARMVGIIRDAVIGNNWIVTNSFWASDGTLCFNLRHESGSNPDAFKRAFPAACVYLRAKRGKKLPSPNIFTIASSPMDEGVQLLAYRRGGSFTTDMDFLVQEGITVKLEGPYSTFTPQLDETGEALIIASEIGIGALMAILRHAVKMYHLKKLKKRIRIIFYCKNPRCIIFPEEVKYLVNTLAKNEAEVYYSPATHRNELVYGPATPSVSSVTASRVGGGRPAAIPLQTIPSSSFSLHPSSTLSLNGDSDAMQVPEYTGTNTVTSRREKTGRGKEKKGKMSAKRRETLSDDADRKLRLKSIDTSADSGDGTAEEESDRSNSSTSATASSSSALYGNGKGSYRHSARLDSYTSLAHSSNESESDETEGAQKRQSKMLSTPLSLRMSPYSSSSSSYSSLTPARNHLSTAVLPEPRRIKKKIRQTHKLSCIRFAYLFHDFGALDELKQNEHMKEWIPLHGMGLCFEGDISTPLFEKMIDDASKVSVYTYGAFKKADTILKHPPFNISFNRIISSAYEI